MAIGDLQFFLNNAFSFPQLSGIEEIFIHNIFNYKLLIISFTNRAISK